MTAAKPCRWGALVAVAILLVAACGGGGGFAAKPVPADARPGGVLRVGLAVPGSIEPSNAYEPAGVLVAQTMCDTLLTEDPVTGELKLGLASRYVVSGGGKTVTIRIRKGARFSNGDKVTADDAIFTLTRVASQAYASNVAGRLGPVSGFGVTHGETDVKDPKDRLKLLGLQKITVDSFSISLESPVVEFLHVLAQPLAAVLPEKLVKADPDAFARRPVCAGPYEMERPWAPGERSIALRRSKTYSRVEGTYSRGGRGYADRIVFSLFDDAPSEVAAYKSGQLDVAHVGAKDIEAARAQLPSDLVLAPGPLVDYVGLPPDRAPFDQPAVRRALSLALDRTAIAQQVFGGSRTPATRIIPPTAKPAELPPVCGLMVPATANIEEAKTVLRLSGAHLEGRKLAFYFNDEYRYRPMMQAVADQWKAAFGLEVELKPMSWEPYLTQANGPGGLDGAFRVSWRGEYNSPDAYMFPLFHSSQVQSNNLARFAVREYDRELERGARRATAVKDRTKRYQNLENALCGLLPLIPIAVEQRALLIRPGAVNAAAPNPVRLSTGDANLRELHLRGAT